MFTIQFWTKVAERRSTSNSLPYTLHGEGRPGDHPTACRIVGVARGVEPLLQSHKLECRLTLPRLSAQIPPPSSFKPPTTAQTALWTPAWTRAPCILACSQRVLSAARALRLKNWSLRFQHPARRRGLNRGVRSEVCRAIRQRHGSAISEGDFEPFVVVMHTLLHATLDTNSVSLLNNLESSPC